MRVGLVTPRLNGIPMRLSLGRIGYDPGTAQAQIDSYTNSFLYGLPSDTEHGTAATPDVVAQSLMSAASDTCKDSNQCPDLAAQIAASVAKYTAAYNAAQANTQAQVESGQIAVPSDYFAANPTVYSPYQNPNVPNALNTAAPQQTVVTTPAPTNALTPPSTTAPVSGTNAGTGTGTTALTSGPGTINLSGTVALGGLNIPMWALLGAAALGIFAMVKGK